MVPSASACTSPALVAGDAPDYPGWRLDAFSDHPTPHICGRWGWCCRHVLVKLASGPRRIAECALRSLFRYRNPILTMR